MIKSGESDVETKMRQCFRLKKCYGNKAEEYHDANGDVYPNEGPDYYNFLTVSDAFTTDALLSPYTTFQPGFFSFTIFNIHLQPQKTHLKRSAQTIQVEIKNVLGKMYEFSDPYGSANFIDFQYDRDYYIH